MESKDFQTIFNDIHKHIQKQGGPFSDWYIGITADIEKRLFGNHNVPKKNHWYIYREAYTIDDARAIEKAFLDHGCDGGTGGGEDDAVVVYAYLKTNVTNQ